VTTAGSKIRPQRFFFATLYLLWAVIAVAPSVHAIPPNPPSPSPSKCHVALCPPCSPSSTTFLQSTFSTVFTPCPRDNHFLYLRPSPSHSLYTLPIRAILTHRQRRRHNGHSTNDQWSPLPASHRKGSFRRLASTSRPCRQDGPDPLRR
jgi:hypothetical protein